MKDALVSVIIPCYNVEKYLGRCLKTVVNQTYKNLEIILVDDGSKDNTPVLCDEWAKKDKRIRTVHIENKGVANARNVALDLARGEYISFVDSDDYVENEMIESLITASDKFNADISICGYVTDNEKTKSGEYSIVDKSYAVSQSAVGDYTWNVLWNKLYRKSAVSDIRMPDFECCEDMIFNFHVINKAKVIVKTDESFYHYIQNENSIVHSNFKIGAFDALKAKEIVLNELENTEYEKYAVKGLVATCFVLISGIVKADMFMDKYNMLRDNVLKYKKEIFFSGMYSKRDKIKTLVLLISPKIFNKLILQ